jgi:hypothetical protein
MTSIFEGNGRRPQFFMKLKTTLIFQEMEEDLNFRIWKTTSTFQEMEDNLSFSGNERRLKFSADTKYF